MSTSLPQALLDLLSPPADAPLPDPLPREPFPLFKRWFDEERAAKRQPNPDAMTLATADPDGAPSCRVVLCRGIDVQRGSVTFFTNYASRKGSALIINPRACANFHWDHSDRQARIEGVVVQTTARESDDYFRTRPWQSRLSAWVSDQSRPISRRRALLSKVGPILDQLGLNLVELLAQGNQVEIPRPPHWGGYRLYASRVELWVAATGRFHDRAEWRRTLPLMPWPDDHQTPVPTEWTATRVQP